MQHLMHRERRKLFIVKKTKTNRTKNEDKHEKGSKESIRVFASFFSLHSSVQVLMNANVSLFFVCEPFPINEYMRAHKYTVQMAANAINLILPFSG